MFGTLVFISKVEKCKNNPCDLMKSLRVKRSIRPLYPASTTCILMKAYGRTRKLDFNMQEEMIKLRDLGANTPTGIPYIEEGILAISEMGSGSETGGRSGEGGSGGVRMITRAGMMTKEH
nr:hypothetical protein [Tanacetum cinerariifolium]